MSFGDLKISEAAIQSTGVQSQPDTLTGSAPDNKLVFDALPTLIIQKLNSLLDLLGGTGAAGEMPIAPIDGMTATTVQQALAELRQALTAYINLVQGITGAAQVGVSAISGMQAQNAQAALGELKALIDNLVIGALPPGSVTADMIADGAIVQLGALLAVAAAAAYDSEGSYAVGDYCTHGGKLHKCGTAIPDGEAWMAEHWTETSVAAELAEVHDLLAPLGGATTPQAALAALGAGVRPNLLDNAIFVGGGSQQGGGQLPINQRGQTSYACGSSFTYGVDRWLSGDYYLTETGMGFKSATILYQRLPVTKIDTTKTLTYSALWTDGTLMTCSGNPNVGAGKLDTDKKIGFAIDPELNILWVSIESLDNVSKTVIGVKLEYGDRQTLAYQDSDGTWHLLPQPDSDYATQLAKCQRYLYALENITMCPGGVENNDLIFGVRFPVEMRIAPVFIGAEGGNNLQLYIEGSSGFYENQNFTLQWSSRTGATIKCQSPISLLPNSACNGRIDGKLMFSAEL